MIQCGKTPVQFINSQTKVWPRRKLFSVLFSGLIFVSLHAGASGPPIKTPAPPPFPASEAAKLGDEYVSKKFPQFPDLYCSEVIYDSEDNMKPDRSVIWRLRYIIPNNPRMDVKDSPFPDWGVCLVFVHRDMTVTHTLEPKRNSGK